MSDEATVIPMEDFEETMTNATPDELKQVSAWLQKCGRIDAQRCEMDDDKPPISLDKPPFPLEIKKAGSAAAGTVTPETGSALTITSTPAEPGDDVIQRAWELAVGSAVRLPGQPAIDGEPDWIGDDYHHELKQCFIRSLGRPDAILFNGDMMDIKLNSGGRAKTRPVNISKEAVEAMDDIHLRVLANMFDVEAVKDPYAAVLAANPGMSRQDVKDAYYRSAYGEAGAWTHSPHTETTAQLMMDRINAGYNRKAGTFDTEGKPRSAKTAAFHAVLRKMTWRLSKMGMAFEVWCSIGLSVVTGPWEERHEVD